MFLTGIRPRYARGLRFGEGIEAIGGPWSDSGEEHFYIPFVFSANGRPYLKQIETHSGIWFRDVRKAGGEVRLRDEREQVG